MHIHIHMHRHKHIHIHIHTGNVKYECFHNAFQNIPQFFPVAYIYIYIYIIYIYKLWSECVKIDVKFAAWLPLTHETEMHGESVFDTTRCCQPHRTGHGYHPDIKMDMDVRVRMCACAGTCFVLHYHDLLYIYSKFPGIDTVHAPHRCCYEHNSTASFQGHDIMTTDYDHIVTNGTPL